MSLETRFTLIVLCIWFTFCPLNHHCLVFIHVGDMERDEIILNVEHNSQVFMEKLPAAVLLKHLRSP